jgi:rhomboid protease GluP
MTAPEPSLESILRLCAESAPHPWYPAAHAREKGLDSKQLVGPIDRLRDGGLIDMTEWVEGKGQGYVLTPAGTAVLRNPYHLERLEQGVLPVVARPRPASERAEDEGDLRTRGAWGRGETVRNALFEPAEPKVTPVLIWANVLVFLYSLYLAARARIPLGTFLAQGAPSAVHDCGGLTAGDLLRGEWWRLLTSCFVHWGAAHLLANMWSLHVLGRVAEPVWGRGRFLVLYLLSGVGGACTAMLSTPGGLLAGASGAIWGVMTSLVAWVLLNRRFLPPHVASDLLRQLSVAVLINVGISFLPFVSAAAHFGGGAVGFLTASLLNVNRFEIGPRRALATVGLALMPVLCVLAVAKARDSDPRWPRPRSAVAIVEANDFERVRRPEFTRVLQDADAVVLKQVLPILEIDPARRRTLDGARAVTQVRLGLDELRDRIDLEDSKLNQPYQTPEVEAERQAVLARFANLKHDLELFDLRLKRHEKLTEEDWAALKVYKRQPAGGKDKGG